NDPSLSITARAWITDPNNTVLISPATYWEIAIKVSAGKLNLGGPYEPFVLGHIRRNGFTILPIRIDHAAVVATLPLHHRDPFDRMLVAQALAEQIPLLSRDPI